MDNGYAAWVARWRVPMGLALGVAYLVFAQPSGQLLAMGVAIAFAGLALRAYAAGYLEKNNRLATDGPYAHTRNPLYLGSFLMGIGLIVAGRSWFLAVAFLLFFLGVYLPVMRREAKNLQRLFGEAYQRYATHVPLFLPAWRGAERGEEQFRLHRYLKNREYEAAIGYVAVVIFLALKVRLR